MVSPDLPPEFDDFIHCMNYHIELRTGGAAFLAREVCYSYFSITESTPSGFIIEFCVDQCAGGVQFYRFEYLGFHQFESTIDITQWNAKEQPDCLIV